MAIANLATLLQTCLTCLLRGTQSLMDANKQHPVVVAPPYLVIIVLRVPLTRHRPPPSVTVCYRPSPSVTVRPTPITLPGTLPPVPVIKAVISQVLGLGIVAGSFLVKLPQILKLVAASSATGLQPASFEIETFCALVAATYGFANNLSFSAFGEAVGLAVQNVILLALIYRYQRRSATRIILVAAALLAWIALANSSYLTASVLDRLVDANSLVLLVSRVPQIVSNHAQKSTGQLSFLTYFLNFMGTVARVFTTIQEPNATSAMMRGVLMSMTMNGLIVGQIVAYGGGEDKAAVEKKKKKKA